MPLPTNPSGYGPMTAGTPISGPTFTQPMQPQPQQQFVFQQPPQMIQPVQNYPNAPVMSIAPVSGRENAIQFPVGVGTELWLVDKMACKIYVKTNSANPREMQEIDFTYVVNQQVQNETVTRAEFDEMKGMMAQMMSMLQSNQHGDQPRKQKSDWKRGNRNDQSDGSSANNG